MEGFFDRLFRIAFLVMFLGIVGVGAMVSYPQYVNARALDRQREGVMQQIKDKERELELVREKKRRFSTDVEFVESLARKNRRVYPGEVVFVFDD